MPFSRHSQWQRSSGGLRLRLPIARDAASPVARKPLDAALPRPDFQASFFSCFKLYRCIG